MCYSHARYISNCFSFKIIRDQKKKNGNYEYGAWFYTAAKKRGGFRQEDEWWFVQSGEITKTLSEPQVEMISSNRSLYYFDDFLDDKK